MFDIRNIELSERAINCLVANNIDTYEKLIALEEDQLRLMRNAGAKTVKEILEYISKETGNEVAKKNLLNVIDRNTLTNEVGGVFFLINNTVVECQESVKALRLPEPLERPIIESGIETIQQLIFSEMDSIKAIRSYGKKKVDALVEELGNKIVISFVDENVESGNTDKMYEAKILQLVDGEGISYQDLKFAMSDLIKDSEKLHSIISNLIEKKQVEEVYYKFTKFLPWAKDYFPLLKEKRQAEVLSLRTQGRTLDETGKILNGISRERVRQLEAKGLKHMPKTKESRFVYWFDNYEINKNDFMYIFGISESSYYYIKYYLQGKNTKKKPMLEMFDDELLPHDILLRLESIARQYCVKMNGVYIPIGRDHILKRLMEIYHKSEACDVSTLYDEYNAFIDDRGLLRLNDRLLFGEPRVLEAFLERKDYVVCGQNHTVRYYNFKEYDFSDLFSRIDFETFRNSQISTGILFKSNLELMDEFDIKNENELHNIFKNFEEELKEKDIHILRMPNISVGESNLENQTIRLLYKVAPIGVNEFAAVYQESYGVETRTFLANHFDFVSKYNNHGILDVAQEGMNDDELRIMAEELKEDFYFVEDVEKKYMELFPKGNVDRVNPLNLKKLGFQVYSNYIVGKRFSTSDEYWNHFLLSNEYLDFNSLDRRFIYNQTFYQNLEKLRVNFDLIEVEKGKYISFEKLVKKYPFITKQLLQDYTEQLPEYVVKDVFTVKYAENIGFKSPLDEIDENDKWILSSLLRANKNIGYKKLGDNIIFSHKQKHIDVFGLVSQILDEEKSILMSNLINKAKEEYGVTLDKYKIIKQIEDSNYYYNTETGMIELLLA